MISFASCFMIGKADGWGTFPKCRAKLSYCLILGPLFWECAHPRALPYIWNPPSTLSRAWGSTYAYSGFMMGENPQWRDTPKMERAQSLKPPCHRPPYFGDAQPSPAQPRPPIPLPCLWVFYLYPTKNNIFKIDILNALGEKLPIIICHYPTANVNE